MSNPGVMQWHRFSARGVGCLALISVAAISVFPAIAAPEKTSAHPHGDFEAPCAQCHSADAWSPARIGTDFDHGALGFPLEGAHAGVDCLFCHTTLEFEAVSGACASCHQDVHQGEFGQECARCHNTRSFVDRSEQLALHRETRFPLTGTHLAIDCEACHHGNGSADAFVNTPTECYACHQGDYESTTGPNHVQAGFATDCTQCHGTGSWTAGTNVGSHEFFPLKGGHGGLECARCHTSGNYTALDPSCVSCHRDAYDATTDPVHRDAGFATECEACHTINAWLGAVFDHGTTAFPLTGAHRAVGCAQCHTQGSYAAASSACFACHQSDFQSVTDPDHVRSGFSQDCEVCHTTTTWTGAVFDHDASGFPLTGAHRTADCNQCHIGGTYAGTPQDCVACHRSDYDATNDPPHQAAGFGTDCDACHGTTTWQGATFDHNTFFPIYSGAHRGKWDDCSTCHTNPATYAVYDCLVCHPHSDRTKTDNKHKDESGYRYDSVACYDCHPRGKG